ncbi:ATP-binding protein [Pseudoclavibacter sp. CFCC 11306]|uniref:ATP-binding protein n=1 Tax=Pseudoclavibacter sp. CFCC 11306 TaxID=1564493 RepID=UPI001787E7FD|nr:AAA family ATPase [Pseudoclavibacter sp. CFCC 11306]
MTTVLPGGFEDDEPDIVEGQLFRVLSNFDGSVLLELRNGNTARANGPGLADLEPGDVFLLADGRVERLAAESWPAGDRTGTVVWAGSTDIVVKSAGSTYSFRQRADDPFEKGQTVRLGPDGQPVAVIADEPIDDLSLLRDDDFDPESLVVRKEDNTTSVEDFGGSILLVRRALDLATVALSPDDPLRTMGVNPIKGMLFSGPSGTGKTFLARGLAAKLDASFYNVGGPAIVDKFVGQTERRLREIFEHAQDNGPAILFFDEIDSLYTQRGEHNHEATNRLVGQFLSLLDGFVAYDRVLIIATTNLPGALDDALLRPGRLGHKLVFSLPSKEDRVQILSASSRKVVFRERPDLSALAQLTQGWTAAELAAIWTEAGLAATLDHRKSIAWEDILIGVETVDRDRKTHLKAE